MTEQRRSPHFLTWDEPTASKADATALIEAIFDGSIQSRAPRLERGVNSDLNRARDQSQLNPQVKAATTRAFQRALRILLRTQETFSYGSTPYIVVPGDGGIIVEWAVGDDFVSANLDAFNREMDLIYVRQNGLEECNDFSYDRLDHLFTALFSGEEITPCFTSIATNSTTIRPAFLWSDSTESGTVA